jgi:hypothetical protein
MPDSVIDPHMIAVHDAAGRRLGCLSAEAAAEYADLMDAGLVQLSGRLLAVGEPGYDAGRAMTHPPLLVNVHTDPASLDEYLARNAPG